MIGKDTFQPIHRAMAGPTKGHTAGTIYLYKHVASILLYFNDLAVKAFVELGVKPWAKTTAGQTTLEVLHLLFIP